MAFAAVAALLCVNSCSTTRLVPEGRYRLASSEIVIKGAPELDDSEIEPYIRQQANSSLIFGWSPAVAIYNWSNGSGGGINAVWESLGTAPVVFNEALMHDSVENVKRRLHYLGYYDAKVDASLKLNEKKRLAGVEYLIEPGGRHIIDSISFELPEGEFREDFLKDSHNIGVKVGDYLAESTLEAETQRGADYFRSLGYYNFNQNNYFFEADTLSGNTVLHYRIRPYTRNEIPTDEKTIPKYYINKVSIEYPGNIRFREAKLRNLNTIQPGKLYSEDLVNATYYRLSALNTFNSVSIEMEPADSAKLDCRISLSGNDVYGFKVDGEFSSNSSGLLGISPQLSYYHRNIFHGGESLNLGFTGNWQFLPGSSTSATELGASASIVFPEALGFSMDWVHGNVIPQTEIMASYNYQNRPEYTRHISSLAYSYSGQISSSFFYQVYPFQMSIVQTGRVSDAFESILSKNPYLWDTFMDQVDLGIGTTLRYTTNPDIVPKTSYTSARFSLDLSGNVLAFAQDVLGVNAKNPGQMFGLPYNQYVRLETSLARVFRFGNNDAFAMAMRVNAGVGYAYGNSTALPFEKQFYCGGASSMRGWQARTLGPGFSKSSDMFIIPSQTGNLKLEADIEYRFPLVWKLEGALFAEAGNVWEMENIEKETFVESIAADWGIGMRINLDFLLIRIDAGFKVHDPAREPGQRWIHPSRWLKSNGSAIHFGVGYPF